MYSLFNIQPSSAQGVLHLPEWLYCKTGLQRNLQQVIKFYRNNPMAVNSDHFLVKLLHSITIPHSHSLERYYANVDAVSLNLSMALKMTSSIYQGKLFDGTFFGPGNDEILIASDEDFDFEKANADWKNVQAVKVLRHPRSDLGLNLPDGTNTGSEDGLVIVTINIAMLAVQYRAFRYEEMKATTNDDGSPAENQRSIMQFIHMFVLPNMLYSYLDHAVFNRMANLERGIPLGDSEKKHPFFLIDFSSKLTYVHNAMLNYVNKVDKDFNGILQNVPVVTLENAAELMEVPNLPLTRQLLWSLVLSRLPELLFLTKVTANEPGKRNQSEVNRIIRYVTNYKRDNIFRQVLHQDLYSDVMEDLEEITEVHT